LTVSPIDRPGVGRSWPDDHAEQGRLAGAVRPDDPDDAGARQRERQVLDQQPVAEALAQALDLDDGVAEARPGRDGDLQLALVPLCVVRLGEQLLVGRQAGLALGLARPGAMRTHSSSRARVRWRASTSLSPRASRSVQLLLEPAGVVALERDPAAAVQLEDPLATLSRKYRSWVTATTVPAYSSRKRSSHATDSASRWLVGSSSSSRSGCWSSSRHSATRRFSPPESVVTSASSGGQRSASMAISTLRSTVPRVGGVDLVLERGLLGADCLVVGVGVGPLGHDRVVAVDQVLDLAHAVHDVALDVLGGVELRLLAEEADREAGRQAGLAGEAVVQAGHDPQQAGLACPVRSDDADLGARVERDGDVLEHGPVRAGSAGRACMRCR
jgi:hypothetical protein